MKASHLQVYLHTLVPRLQVNLRVFSSRAVANLVSKSMPSNYHSNSREKKRIITLDILFEKFSTLTHS